MKSIFVAALKEETPALNKFHHTGVGKINACLLYTSDAADE